MTVTPPVLVGAYRSYLGFSPVDYFRAQQQSLPPPGVYRFRYGTDSQGYYFWLQYNDTIPYDTVISCSGLVYAGERLYYLNFRSSASITCPNGQNWDGAGNPATYRVAARHIPYIWNQFRGKGGVNPSAPPTQEDANTWAQTQIDSGHWPDVVKPALDAMIRAAANNMDMATLGITGNPPFDGDLGPVELAGLMNKLNTLASRITGPPSVDWAQDEANRDWIRSTRLSWNLTRTAFEVVPN